MTLGQQISQLRDDCLASLDASHNFYAHTQSAWRLVHQTIQEGGKLTFRNAETNDTIDQEELAILAQDYVARYLTSATFQNFVSQLELFTFDLLRVWLTEYPGRLSGNQLRFRTVLDAADKNEVVASVVEKEVLGLAYQKVSDWFAYLEKIAQLGCPSPDQIQQLAEIEASRDVLVHNNGIVNSVYVVKSAQYARFAEGQTLELPESYHRESWQLIKQVVNDLADASVNKLRT